MELNGVYLYSIAIDSHVYIRVYVVKY